MNFEVLLSEGLESFLLAMTVSGRSSETIDLYRRSIKPMIDFLGDQSININPTQIRSYLAELQTKVNPVTVGIRWRSIRAFLNWLYQEGYTNESPTAKITPPKVPKQFPHVLNEKQIKALLKVAKAKAKNWVGYRNLTMILLLLECGLRSSELCKLKLRDLNLSQHALMVVGKGNRERQVFFGRKLSRKLRFWLGKRSLSFPSEFLFCTRQGGPLSKRTLGQFISRYGNEAGVRDVRCSPHTLRHTFATQFIKNGGDPFSLQKLMGHSDIATTMVYVHMAGELLQEAQFRASPIDRLLE